MKKAAMWTGLVAVLVLLGAPAGVRAQETAAQATPPKHFYKLNFTVEETNDAGKIVNSRNYLAILATDAGAQTFKTGSRIPIATGMINNATTQFQYVDVGVNFEVIHASETGDKLGFQLKAEVSSIGNQANPGAAVTAGDPVIRQNSWSSTVLIPVGKPTVVFLADDLDSKGKMQVELTATRVD
jgi:hypothetical protein